tara:strand:+ start:10191 stop:10586 length:396 start_codon:yes stop_codon:yes gene_type:complete
MKNTEKLYIAKEAGFRSMLGSRGTTGLIRRLPDGPYEPTLFGARGLKGLTQPKLTQLAEAPATHNLGYHGKSGVTYGRAIDPTMEATPLAKLLQLLGLGAGGGGIGYAGYKGLEADDNLGEPYNYQGNPND